MATKSKQVDSERVEAVIISGPRKGELIMLDAALRETEPQLTPEEDAALDAAIEAAGRAAESATALRVQTQEFGATLERINKKYDELLGQSSGHNGAPVDGGRGNAKRQKRDNSKPAPNGRARPKARKSVAAVG